MLLAAAALAACSTPIPEELDPMVELRPRTFESCAELEAFLDSQPSIPGHATGHTGVPFDNLGFEDVTSFTHIASDDDFIYTAEGTRFSIYAERDQMARAVGAAVVGDEEFGDRILGVAVDGFQAVVLVGMSQESAPLRDTVLPSRPIDAAILRVMVFDITDPRSPDLQRSIFIDGGLDRAWMVDGKITVVANTGFHNPSASEGRGRNLPASFPYLYDLHIPSGDAWVHQDDPVAFCTNAVTSNVATSSGAKMLVTFDLDDEQPGLSSSLLLDSASLRHATRDAAVFAKANGSSQVTDRVEGTYLYRFATDGAVARIANWTQVDGRLAGYSPIDERDGELRVGMKDKFWRLSVPDGPGPLERDEIVWGLLPREEVREWRFRGDHAFGMSVEYEERNFNPHRWMVWRLDPSAKARRAIGPDMPPEQVPVSFELVDSNELAYVTKETETERRDGEDIPVEEHFRGRVVNLDSTPAKRVGAFQYTADVGGGSNYGGRVFKFSNALYGTEVPKLGQLTIHRRTENGVLNPAQNVDHVDIDGVARPMLELHMYGNTLWTLSEVALALVDMETVGVTHYYDL